MPASRKSCSKKASPVISTTGPVNWGDKETMDLIEKLRSFYHTIPKNERPDYIKKYIPADMYRWWRYDSGILLREDQVIPHDYKGRYWLSLKGRGSGKTFEGSFQITKLQKMGESNLAIIAPRTADLDNPIFEAIKYWYPPDEQPNKVGFDRIEFKTGQNIMLFSSQQGEFRGPNLNYVWCDEIVKWCDEDPEKAQKYLQTVLLALRLGRSQMHATTTEKHWDLFQIWEDKFAKKDQNYHISRGCTFDNVALSELALEAIVEEVGGGTSFGDQELYSKIQWDDPSAYWSRDLLDKCRVKSLPETGYPIRYVIGVDPAVTKTGDETGIITVVLWSDNNFYVLYDKSGQYAVSDWANKVNIEYKCYEAATVVAEVNNGGDAIIQALKTVNRNMNIKSTFSTSGKLVRAESVAILYQQHRVFHVCPEKMINPFERLEKQMTTYTAKSQKSPDRLDALVFAIKELAFKPVVGPKKYNLPNWK